jgi:hypothetical protein
LIPQFSKIAALAYNVGTTVNANWQQFPTCYASNWGEYNSVFASVDIYLATVEVLR